MRLLSKSISKAQLKWRFTLCFDPTDEIKNVLSDCLKWLYVNFGCLRSVGGLLQTHSRSSCTEGSVTEVGERNEQNF